MKNKALQDIGSLYEKEISPNRQDVAPRTVTATPVPRTMRAITHSIFEAKDGGGGRWRRFEEEKYCGV